MTAFTFRMGAGFAGEVTRTHPASIYARLNDAIAPVLAYGMAAFYNGSANDIRAAVAGDASATAVRLAGVLVRPYPLQVKNPNTAWGSQGYSTPTGSSAPAGEPVDVLDTGSILVPIVGTPNLGDPVFVWCAAASGAHVQGGFEAVGSGGNTVPVINATFGNPPDANGLGEIILR